MLLAVILISRLALLLLSRRYLMSDEAVVGVMALDIMEGKPIPFFLYGQTYADGHVAEALLMIPWLKLFGPSDLVVKGVVAMIGCLHLVVVYRVIHRFFSKRLALLTLALYAFTCGFVSFNFLVNGAMTTLLFSWIGLYFFFCHYYGEKPRTYHLILAGAALGFAVYCFDYAIFYVIAAVGLMAFRRRFALWRRWWEFAALGGGMAIGAAPLIVFNFKHDFSTFRRFVTTPDSGQALLPAFFKCACGLLVHDFPGSFATEINTFAPRIPWSAYLCWGVLCLTLGALIINMRKPILKGLRSLVGITPPGAAHEERITVILYFIALYGAMYCMTGFAGRAPRYVLLFYPFLQMLFAWALLRLGRARHLWGIILVILVMTPQAWALSRMAGERTVNEWNISLHGEDVKKSRPLPGRA